MLEWLTEEFEAAKTRVRPSHLQWMAERGVDSATLAAIGGWGVARIMADGASWQPDSEGEAAVILPVWTPDDTQLGLGRTLYDLVAFRPNHPETTLRRRMDAVWLGEDELEVCAFWHLPPTVRADPMSWLRAGGRGVVILERDAAVERLLEWREVCGETELVSKRLRADLTRALLCRLPCVATTPPPRPAAALTHDADDAVF